MLRSQYFGVRKSLFFLCSFADQLRNFVVAGHITLVCHHDTTVPEMGLQSMKVPAVLLCDKPRESFASLVCCQMPTFALITRQVDETGKLVVQSLDHSADAYDVGVGMRAIHSGSSCRKPQMGSAGPRPQWGRETFQDVDHSFDDLRSNPTVGSTCRSGGCFVDPTLDKKELDGSVDGPLAFEASDFQPKDF